MSLRQELIENGYDPDAENTQGYVCGKCYYIPTEIELRLGSCPECRQAEREKLAREAVCTTT